MTKRRDRHGQGGIHAGGGINIAGSGNIVAGGDVRIDKLAQQAPPPALLGLLPPNVADFTGRDSELANLVDRL